MQFLPVALGVWLLASCSGPPGRAIGEAPLQLAQPTQVRLLDFDRPVAEVRLGDALPRKLLVDTAAQTSLLAADCARELHLQPHPYANPFRARGSTGLGRELSEFAVVDRLAVGELLLQDCRIPLIDDPALANAGIDGILGLDLLTRITIVVDMRERALHLLPATGGAAVSAWLTESHVGDGRWCNVDLVLDPTPILYVPVDGLEQPMPMVLDTGASRTSFPSSYFAATGSEATGTTASEGVGGRLDVATHRVPAFDLFGLKLDLEATEAIGEKGLLGMDVCGKLVVLVDGPARKAWFHHRQ